MRALLAAVALVFAAPGPRANELARTPLEEQLSGIDFLPVLPASELTALIALTTNPGDDVDRGVVIRALRSLGSFDDDTARAHLTWAINAYRNSDDPIEQLYLIAALESLGEIGGAADVATLSGSLGHDRRDVRAAAARALGQTFEETACTPLKTLGARELELQVRFAIDDALRNLGTLCAFGLE